MTTTGKVATATVATITTLALAPVLLVQGIIALRTDYKANCATDAWMQQDFQLWAVELRTMTTN
jgi:hypothetical protein